MDRIDMIFNLLKNLDKKFDRQGESLTRVESDLKYHIKRTDNLETVVKTKITSPTAKQITITISIVSFVVGIALKLFGVV